MKEFKLSQLDTGFSFNRQVTILQLKYKIVWQDESKTLLLISDDYAETDKKFVVNKVETFSSWVRSVLLLDGIGW